MAEHGLWSLAGLRARHALPVTHGSGKHLASQHACARESAGRRAWHATNTHTATAAGPAPHRSRQPGTGQGPGARPQPTGYTGRACGTHEAHASAHLVPGHGAPSQVLAPVASPPAPCFLTRDVGTKVTTCCQECKMALNGVEVPQNAKFPSDPGPREHVSARAVCEVPAASPVTAQRRSARRPCTRTPGRCAEPVRGGLGHVLSTRSRARAAPLYGAVQDGHIAATGHRLKAARGAGGGRGGRRNVHSRWRGWPHGAGKPPGPTPRPQDGARIGPRRAAVKAVEALRAAAGRCTTCARRWTGPGRPRRCAPRAGAGGRDDNGETRGEQGRAAVPSARAP